MKQAAYPKNEIDRIIALADFNLDYTNLADTFNDLTKLAAKVTGSPISMVNLIDNYTVWTISNYGMAVEQTPREDSVCQYTILEKEEFKVNDLAIDPNFNDAPFVTGADHLRFYHGIPLTVKEHNLGALCVLDRKEKELSAEKIEMLKIIADEVVNRLKTIQYIESLRYKVYETKQAQNKVAHDIRGPIAGIMGLADIISQQGKNNNLDEVLEFIRMIYKGGKSVLELADDILSEDKKVKAEVKKGEEMLLKLKDRFGQLYTPQARTKNIELKIEVLSAADDIKIPQPKLMQIAGNLISNAIKFTPRFGNVTVTLEVQGASEQEKTLHIIVKDTGAGITKADIDKLLNDNSESTEGTEGETGYGFGLTLVKHLVKGLNGTFNIISEENNGSQFQVAIPFSL